MTTNTTTPSREEMIQTIEKVVANKELSFGCIIQSKYGESIYLDTRPGQLYNIYRPNYKITDKEEKIKIIGHPVMIGDVMDFIEKNSNQEEAVFYGNTIKIGITKEKKIEILNYNLNIFWTEKRKPINEQGDECVKFVYNLIS